MKEQHDILTGMLNCTEAASILLAMTTSLADENALKELLQKQGYKFAVTELGGDASKSEFREKMTRSIIGACLNCSVISKTAQRYMRYYMQQLMQNLVIPRTCFRPIFRVRLRL